MTITYDMLFTPEHKEEFTETQRSMESQSGNISRAKLRIYAEKMGYLKDEKIDINEFLNNQIEEAYIKIEKALQVKLDYINLCQKKIDKLEGNDEDEEEGDEDVPAQDPFKESLSAKKRKEKALKPKGKYDIDFVSTEKKIQNLQKTITLIKNQIEHGKPPEPFRPTSAVSAILGKPYLGVRVL